MRMEIAVLPLSHAPDPRARQLRSEWRVATCVATLPRPKPSRRTGKPPSRGLFCVGPDRDRTCDLGIKSPANVSNVSAGGWSLPRARTAGRADNHERAAMHLLKPNPGGRS